MSTIQERLATFLSEYNLSAQGFERKCGIGVATASKLSENSRETTFRKIAKAFPQLNIDWLRTGEGEMLNQSPNIDIDLSIHQSGGGNAAFGDVNNINDPKSQIAILRERIKALEVRIEEKDARIAGLTEALDRERKMNDFLMGQK